MIKLPPDITFLIQLVIFVVFWQLMRVILFQPVQRALKMRAERTAGALARAATLATEAAQVSATIETGLAEAKADAARQAEEIRRVAEAAERTILDRYQGEAATLLDRERGLTERQVETARQPLEADVTRLAESVVVKLLGRAA